LVAEFLGTKETDNAATGGPKGGAVEVAPAQSVNGLRESRAAGVCDVPVRRVKKERELRCHSQQRVIDACDFGCVGSRAGHL